MKNFRRPIHAVDSAQATMTIPALVTLPNVELLEVGEDWEASTGLFTCTPSDIISAIGAVQDPGVRTPVVKLGHTDPRFDGQPAVGRIINMRASDNGMTLLGDLTGLPGWLAACMASAYPRRSIEGYFDYQSRTGNHWDFMLTGVALLGEAYPAVNTLEDIQAIWGNTPPTLIPVDEVPEMVASGQRTSGFYFMAAKEDDLKWRHKSNSEVVATALAQIMAGTSTTDVTRAYYESIDDTPGAYWWWIREVRISPFELIVDDDEGGLFRVPYTIEGDTVAFEAAVPVKIEYVDTPVAASGNPILVAARWDDPVAAGRVHARTTAPLAQADDESATIPPSRGESDMQLSDEAIRRLGLDPATATEAEVTAAILAQVTETPPETEVPPTPAPTTDPVTPPAPVVPSPEAPPTGEGVSVPEGMVLVDAAAMAGLQRGAQLAIEQNDRNIAAARTSFIEDAVRAGKFPRSRMDHYSALMVADEVGTRQMIDQLASGLIPVAETPGAGMGGDSPGQDVAAAYPKGWEPTVKASQKSLAGSIKIVRD